MAQDVGVAGEGPARRRVVQHHPLPESWRRRPRPRRETTSRPHSRPRRALRGRSWSRPLSSALAEAATARSPLRLHEQAAAVRAPVLERDLQESAGHLVLPRQLHRDRLRRLGMTAIRSSSCDDAAYAHASGVSPHRRLFVEALQLHRATFPSAPPGPIAAQRPRPVERGRRREAVAPAELRRQAREASASFCTSPASCAAAMAGS